MTPAPPRYQFYQSKRFRAYTDRLIHAFTGKPDTLGGPEASAETLLANRQGLCRALAVPAEALTISSQVHSDISRLDTDPDTAACDAILLTRPHIPVLVFAADCVPVLLYDPVRHVGAAIHAGWRGTAQGITAKTLQRLTGEFGSDPEQVIAAIGPSAASCCYEVSDEVVDAVAQSVPPQNRDALIAKTGGSGRPHIDLKRANQWQLEALGCHQVDVLPHCTICAPEAFFSYRRGEAGRQGAVMMLR